MAFGFGGLVIHTKGEMNAGKMACTRMMIVYTLLYNVNIWFTVTWKTSHLLIDNYSGLFATLDCRICRFLSGSIEWTKSRWDYQ